MTRKFCSHDSRERLKQCHHNQISTSKHGFVRFIAGGSAGLTLCFLTPATSPTVWAASVQSLSGPSASVSSATSGISTTSTTTTTSAAAVAPALTSQAAQQQAVRMLGIPTSYVLQSQSYQSQGYDSQTPVYTFNYQSSDPNQPNSWINVTMDANSGLILQYNRQTPDNQFHFPPKTSAQVAQQLALQWAKKLYPTQLSQSSLQPLSPQSGSLQGGISYTYNFVRQVNGLAAPFDGFSITVDQNGHLTDSNCHWTSLSFPSAKGVLSTLQANQIYLHSLHLQLAYVQVWHANSGPTTVLAYTQDLGSNTSWWGQQFSTQQTGQPVIDAHTGHLLDAQGNPMASSASSPPQPLVPGGPVLPAPLPTVHWSESQCLSYAERVLAIPSGATLTDSNESSSQGTDTTWNFSWTTADGTHLNAGVDATTGELINFNQYTPQISGKSSVAASGSDVKFSQTQLNQAATNFLEQGFANDTGGIALVPNQFNKSGSAQVVFTYQVIPLVNGIPNMSSEGNLNLDANTGQVQNFWMNSQAESAALPNPRLAIPVAQAQQDWQQGQPLTLEYLQTSPSLPAIKGGPTQSTPSKVVLAYVPVTTAGTSGIFNAVTGAFEPPQVAVPYSGVIHDLKGVPAAPQIQLLVQRELWNVDSQGNVHPNQTLTTGAFVKLLVSALGQQGAYNPQWATSSAGQSALAAVPKSAPDYHELAAAYSLGWLSVSHPVHPNQLITRNEAAQILMQSLGYGAILNHPQVFHLAATDVAAIPSTDLAADTLASTLGVLPLVNNQFDGTHPVTLATAAVAVVEAANIAGLQGPTEIHPMG